MKQRIHPIPRRMVQWARRQFHLLAVAASLMAVPLTPGAVYTQDMAVRVQADGSVTIQVTNSLPRMIAEQQARWFEEYRKRRDQAKEEDDDNKAEPREAPAAPKPMGDQELVAALTKQAEQGTDPDPEEAPSRKVKVDSVTLTNGMVTTATTHSFATLQAFADGGARILQQNGVVSGNLKISKDASNHLNLTFAPREGISRYRPYLRRSMMANKGTMAIRFVLPGKVLQSGFPETNGRETGIKIENGVAASVDAALKLQDGPLTIVAELGELKINEPVIATSPSRGRGLHPSLNQKLPITDAGPGFTAEASSVRISTLHLLSAEASLPSAIRSLNLNTGMVVQAKLFPPKGRTFLSVGTPRVLRATDDHGAAIAAAHTDSDPESMGEFDSGLAGGRDQGSRVISLDLVTPSAQTSSIEELEGEVVALTAGTWKEQVIENPSNHLKAEIDLGSLVPGAKCVLTKINTRNPQQVTISAKVTGPPESQRIELKLRPESEEGFNSHSYNSSSHPPDPSGQVVRTVELQGYSFSADAGRTPPAKLPKLVFRMPQDLKHERIKFTLKGLDLL